MSGLFAAGFYNDLPEIYDPATDTWTPLNNARLTLPLYPFMFLLPNGKLFQAGPSIPTKTLDIATETWTDVGDSPVAGISAVAYLPGKIMKCGGGNPAVRTAAVIDMTAATPPGA